MLDSVSWTLLAIAGGGLLVFIVAMVFDGLFDFGGDVPVLQAIGVFAGVGAGTSLVMRGAGLDNIVATSALGGALGVGGVLLLNHLVARARRSEHLGREVDFSSLVGSEASVLWWDGDHGEVLVDVSGQRLKIRALALEQLPVAPKMRVTSYQATQDLLQAVTVESLVPLPAAKN